MRSKRPPSYRENQPRSSISTPAPSPDRLLIIADDLTGTMDAIASFAGTSPAPFIGFNPASIQHAPADAACIAINTNTRHVSPAEAKRVVRDLAKWGLDHGLTVLFKKTDSTLRGNIAAELAGLYEATNTPNPTLIFAPAFPEAGRTVQAGHLSLDGVPIHKTSLARDPRSPVQNSSVIAMLATSLPGDRHHLTSVPVVADLSWFSQLAPGCHVLDAETPADMAHIAATLRTVHHRPLLLAGSAGLGKHLPSIIGRPQSPSAPSATLPPGPALILHGSVTPRSLVQVARFKGHEALSIELGPDWLWASPEKRSVIENRWWLHIGGAFAENKSVLVHTSSLGLGTGGSEDFAAWGRSAADYAREAPFAIARLGRRILELTGYRVLVLGGGETSQATIEALDVTHGNALGEVFIGVNRLTINALGRSLELVTKSGGLGPENLYEHYLP